MVNARDEPSDTVVNLMTRLLVTFRASAAADLADLDLTLPAARTLVTLLRHGPTQMSRLAELVGLEKTSLSHLLRTLEPRQLIERARVPEDNRGVCASLTPKGLALARVSDELYQRSQSRLLRDLPPSEVERLRKLLELITENARKQEGPVGPVHSNEKAMA